MVYAKHLVVHVIDKRSGEHLYNKQNPPGNNVVAVTIDSSMSMADVALAVLNKVRAVGGNHGSIDVLKFFGHGYHGYMQFGTGLSIDSIGELSILKPWLNQDGRGLELHGCHAAAAFSRTIGEGIAKKYHSSFSQEYLNKSTGFFNPPKGQRDVGKELLMGLSDLLDVPTRGGIQGQKRDPDRNFEGETRSFNTNWYDKFVASQAGGSGTVTGSAGAQSGNPDFVGYSKGSLFRKGKTFGFDLTQDGVPDVYVKLEKDGNRVGFDLSKDGKIDHYVSVVISGNKIGFDLDGDKKADIFPPIIRERNQTGFDLNGDKKIDISISCVKKGNQIGFDLDGDGNADVFPNFVGKGKQAGFDLDGDGKADIFPTAVTSGMKFLGFDLDGDGSPDIHPQLTKIGGQLGFDLNGDNVIDISATLIRSLGRIGFDLNADGLIDMLPPIAMYDGKIGYDTDGDGVPNIPLQQDTTYGNIGRFGPDFNNPNVPDQLEHPGQGDFPLDDQPFGGADGNPFTPG